MRSRCILIGGIYGEKQQIWKKFMGLGSFLSFLFLYLTDIFKRESLDAILNLAVIHCPQAEVLWLMAAKEKWLAGDVPAAREVLERAFVANPESEQIWLAAVKLEAENGELKVARELLICAWTVADTQWVSLIFPFPIHINSYLYFHFSRYGWNLPFSNDNKVIFTRLWLLSLPLSWNSPNLASCIWCKARFTYLATTIPQPKHLFFFFAAGVKSCPKEPTLWILASRLEEADDKSIKAHALLEKACLVNSGNELLWAESIGVEGRSGGAAQAKTMLLRALQECPSSGLLWSMAIWAEPRAARKTKGVDVLIIRS
jgi:pre-mRNA-processing factor 6